MKFNPNSEVEYRRRLAEEFLEDAESRFQSGDFRGCVQFSQLTAENAAKAVIAVKRAPSWSHDPSPELVAVGAEMDTNPEQISRLAEISATLAPEHGRTTYGEPERFATPRELYDSEAAQRALALAKEALDLMKTFLPERAPKNNVDQ